VIPVQYSILGSGSQPRRWRASQGLLRVPIGPITWNRYPQMTVTHCKDGSDGSKSCTGPANTHSVGLPAPMLLQPHTLPPPVFPVSPQEILLPPRFRALSHSAPSPPPPGRLHPAQGIFWQPPAIWWLLLPTRRTLSQCLCRLSSSSVSYNLPHPPSQPGWLNTVTVLNPQPRIPPLQVKQI
jgi:hypothetical protein